MKTTLLVMFTVIMLLMGWESQKTQATLAQGPVPQQSIRLRIIANSDSPEDQVLKRIIRDRINTYVSEKVARFTTIEEPREQMSAEIPVLRQIVEQTITEQGYTYTSTVELGVVPFPTKLYGQYVYPAGDYEALRVTIGAGVGQNWWCVLFPPLCFVDITNGDAVQAPTQVKFADEQDKQFALAQQVSNPRRAKPVQVKFFIGELAQRFF